MRKLMVSKIWISAFLLAVLVARCGDSDKNGNAGNPGAPLTPPTVLSVTPLNASTGVCPTTESSLARKEATSKEKALKLTGRT